MTCQIGVRRVTMSGMRMQNETGAINVLLLPLIMSLLILVGVAVFGVWAFGERQDYKNNVDEKIAVAVEKAKTEEAKVKDAQFAEESKNPLKTYKGPSAYGSVVVKYPKTWSGYVVENSQSDPYVDGYFAKGVVPDVQADSSTFPLRLQVSSTSYSETLTNFESQAQEGSVRVKPYALKKVPSVVGSFVSGAISENKKGYMVILPLRNTTLEIWTESDSYKSDFDKIILPNLTFSP